MPRDVNRTPRSNGKPFRAVALIAITVGLAVFFGYVVGKDLALRDHARATALQAPR